MERELELSGDGLRHFTNIKLIAFFCRFNYWPRTIACRNQKKHGVRGDNKKIWFQRFVNIEYSLSYNGSDLKLFLTFEQHVRSFEFTTWHLISMQQHLLGCLFYVFHRRLHSINQIMINQHFAELSRGLFSSLS